MAEVKPQAREMGLEELAYLERLYQNQYMLVTNAINASVEELQELNSAGKSIEEMGIVSGKESFTNIGGDFYIKTKVKEDKAVVVGIGGGYMAEKDIESAKLFVKAKIDKKNEMINKLVKNRKELEEAIVQLSAKMESMTKGFGNVRRP